MKMHISIHVAGVVDIEVVTPQDIKATLVVWDDHANGYLDDGMQGRSGVSPTMLSMIQFTSGQLLNDALKVKIEEKLKSICEDISLQMHSAGGDA